jgi:pimeloyl-ACP methyl ester carboxylesterase
MAVASPGTRLSHVVPYAAANGLNMYYEVHGDRPPLLLLHGGGGSIPEKWIPFFADRFQVIAIEQMGHGRTADNVDRPFHYRPPLSQWCRALAILLRRLKPMWMAEPSFTREQLQSIDAPTLIIVGDGDIVTPEHAVEMFRTIPAAQLCVVPHSGHGVMPKETILTFGSP